MSLKEPQFKMSKSHQDIRSRIHINDDSEDIGMKIALALTDSITGISYDPANRPGVSNLLDIMSSLSNKGESVIEIAEACKSMSMRVFKNEVARTIVKALESIRERYNHFMQPNNAQYLDDVAAEGSMKAQEMAAKTMNAVRHATGLS